MKSEAVNDQLQKIQFGCSLDADQQRQDMRHVLEDSKLLTNIGTADALFEFLTNKYPTKNWFALVYNDVTGYDYHTINFPIFTFRLEGKNAVITSRPTDFFSPGFSEVEIDKKFKMPKSCEPSRFRDPHERCHQTNFANVAFAALEPAIPRDANIAVLYTKSAESSARWHPSTGAIHKFYTSLEIYVVPGVINPDWELIGSGVFSPQEC